jgi:zinc/manganese transport system substrate-binding protein
LFLWDRQAPPWREHERIGIANHLQIGDLASVATFDEKFGVPALASSAREFAARPGVRRLCAAVDFVRIIVQPAAIETGPRSTLSQIANPQSLLTVAIISLLSLFLSPTNTARAATGADAPTTTAPKKLRVVTTIFPIYCFASGVIGQDGEVQNLLSPNVGPHDYQLSPSDIRKIKEADVVIMNGLGLDNWVTKALEPNKNRRLIVLGDLLPKQDLIVLRPDLDMEGKHKHGHEHEHSPANPHIWLDPQLAIQCVNNISNAVANANPAYKKNAEACVARLQKLDLTIATELEPFHDKPFVTQHDAFPYLVRRYQLKQVGILEPTPDVPPSPRFLADLLKVIREKNVQVIFNDPRSSPRLAKQIAKDVKIRTAELDTLETGKLDPQGYEQGMRRDAATLARELK